MSESIMNDQTENGNLEELKGLKKIDLIIPKVPLINASSNKRQDGRTRTEIRPLFVQAGIRNGVRGSAYLEIGNTKVICVINGPKDAPRKIDFSSTGMLSLELQSVGSKVTEKDTILLKEALEAVIILEKFPKCILEICLTILEDDGSTLSSCITVAGLALMEAGVPIYDIPVGTSLLFEDTSIFLDPTKNEIDFLDFTDSIKNSKGGGIVTMGYLPSREQICLFNMEGKMDSDFLNICMDALINSSIKVAAVLKQQTLQTIKNLS